MQSRNVRMPATFAALLLAGTILAADEGTTITIEVKDKPVTETVDHAYKPGDVIRVVGPKYMMIRLDKGMPENLVYAPKGGVEYPVPHGPQLKSHPEKCFTGTSHGVSARPATPEEIAAYRNVALNTHDPLGQSNFFPHATASNVYRDMPFFSARNTIDGVCENRRHGGRPYQSWGPHKRTDLWWKVDFGRPVEIDKIVLTIRADFPHDSWWKSAVVEFSDGSTEKIDIEKDSEKQTFKFKKRTVTWVRFTELVQPTEELKWCALTEVEVWGRDVK